MAVTKTVTLKCDLCKKEAHFTYEVGKPSDGWRQGKNSPTGWFRLGHDEEINVILPPYTTPPYTTICSLDCILVWANERIEERDKYVFGSFGPSGETFTITGEFGSIGNDEQKETE